MTPEKAIKIAIHCLGVQAEHEVCEECPVYLDGGIACREAARVAINALKEVQQYREIGTVEEFREAVEKEIRFRNISGIHTSLAAKDLDKAAEKIKELPLDVFTIIGIATLHDEFGFGQKRCQRWMDKMNEGADYLIDGLATWEDYINSVKEQLGMDIRIRWK